MKLTLIMKICLLALAAIAVVTHAQLLDFKRTRSFGNDEPEKIEEHDFVEVDPIVFNGYNLGLSVYYGITDYIWTTQNELSIIKKLEMFSVILGDLQNDNYY